MTHVFVAPHPDDVALSCGGLIASLRELGQNVAILTVYSGAGSGDPLTPYQREALGFGSKTLWPASEAFNRADIAADYPVEGGNGEGATAPAWAATDDRLEATQQDADASAKRFWQRASWYRRASIRNKPLAGQVLIDAIPTQGPTYTSSIVEAAAAGEAMAQRRVEDERYAYFAEASIVFLDLADAVFRGYEGDDELLGAPRDDDSSPVEILRREILRLEPQEVYFPLGVGNHVDHQLCRNAGLALLQEGRRWVMPGPDWAGRIVFYEDFPYAWWKAFTSPADLPAGSLDGLPPEVLLAPRYAEVADQLERKVRGISLYESQLDRLFGGAKAMASAVRRYASAVAQQGGLSGSAERYWQTLVD
ncbi:MAG TPA: PIG-L family deacetylase [Candidatus Limnocylindrales bacterium]|nr:PIG-L family deacetylase [Candidatus Limnocylindrales bacterium]